MDRLTHQHQTDHALLHAGRQSFGLGFERGDPGVDVVQDAAQFGEAAAVGGALPNPPLVLLGGVRGGAGAA